MVACVNCGWKTAPELARRGLCLTCAEFERRNGSPRPPPDALGRLHQGETWPRLRDPHFRALVLLARHDL